MKPKPTILLDQEEQALEVNFEKLGTYPDPVKREKIAQHKKAARAYLKKDTRITIRISTSDLDRLKHLAIEEGLPYQSYITSLLHKASTGRLKDVRAG